MNGNTAPRRGGVEANDAWRASLADPSASWNVPESDPGWAGSVRGRLARGIVVPRIEPRFRLAADDVFFCIGSCFAREIEEYLMLCGLDVASLGLRCPDERLLRPAGVVNKFTTASMLNELRWSLEGQPVPESAFAFDPEADGYRDLQLRANSTAVPLSRALERRADVRAYFSRLRRATVVVMTLGLAEVWFDHQTGLYLNVVPPAAVARAHPGRFTCHRSNYTDNLARLEEVWALLQRHAMPGVRLVITVSPVPMQRTFLGGDVLVENAYGKATLRAVAEDVARAHDDVAYFPGYEMATVSDRELVFRRDDELHLRFEAIGTVTGAFLRAFGLELENSHPEFHEVLYFTANPDVHAAVGEGEFVSGFDHWMRHGRAEGRPLHLAGDHRL